MILYIKHFSGEYTKPRDIKFGPLNKTLNRLKNNNTLKIKNKIFYRTHSLINSTKSSNDYVPSTCQIYGNPKLRQSIPT